MAISYTARRVRATLIDYTLVFAMDYFYILKFGTQNEEGGYTVTGFMAFIPVLFWFVYFVICEQYLNGTLGHQLFKLRVVSLDGSHPSLGQTIARRVCDAIEISWCFGLIAYLIAGRSPKHQRLGDIMAKTIVIDPQGYPQDIQFDFEEGK